MIRTIKSGRGIKEKSVSILETPDTKKKGGRNFLLMINGFDEEAGIYLNREELQELANNISQTIAMEKNKE